MHYKTLVILGNGFDRDLGIDLSFNAYCRNRHCIAYHPEKKLWSNFENDIRQKILSWDKERNEESAKEINSEWIAFKKNFSYFFRCNIFFKFNIYSFGMPVKHRHSSRCAGNRGIVT